MERNSVNADKSLRNSRDSGKSDHSEAANDQTVAADNDARFDIGANVNAPKETKDKEMEAIEVLNASLGTPESTQKFLLNLNMLHSLLLALIKKTGMDKGKIPVPGVDVPTAGALIRNADREPQALTDIWNMIQLQKTTEANREGIAKLMDIIKGIIGKMSNIDGIGSSILGLADELTRLSTASATARAAADEAVASSEAARQEMARRKKRGADGADGEDGEESKPGSRRQGGAGGVGGKGEASDLEKRVKDLEEQVVKLQKFRKAATFKIKDLPDDPAALLSSATQLGGAAGKTDKVTALMDLMKTLPSLQADQLKKIGDMLNKALQGDELEKLKRLLAMISGDDQNIHDRLKRLEIFLGIEIDIDSEAGDGEGGEGGTRKDGQAKAAAAVLAQTRHKDLVREIMKMRGEIDELNEALALILKDGGLEAANMTFEEIKRIKDLIGAIRMDQDKIFMTMERVEYQVRENEKNVSAIEKWTRELHEVKADRKWVLSELDKKADVVDLLLKVDVDTYEKDLEDFDEAIQELSGRMASQFEKLKSALEDMKAALDKKLEKSVYEAEREQLRHRLKFIEDVLKWVEEVFNGDHDGAGVKNKIVRYNCSSCDRDVLTTTKQQKRTVNNNSLNVANSIAPEISFKMNGVRKATHFGNYNNSGAAAYLRAVRQRSTLLRERQARAQTKPEPVGRARLADVHRFRNEAYFRQTAPASFLDTFAQDPRPAGGAFTVVRPEQHVLKTHTILPELNATVNAKANPTPIINPVVESNFDIEQEMSETFVMVPTPIILGANEVNLVYENQIFQGDAPPETSGACANRRDDLEDDNVVNPPSSPA